MDYADRPYLLQRRCLVEINTDPQRRCYYGAHARSELVWTAWSELDRFVDKQKAEHSLAFFAGLNDYAVSQRGQGAKCEYRIQHKDEQNGQNQSC